MKARFSPVSIRRKRRMSVPWHVFVSPLLLVLVSSCGPGESEPSKPSTILMVPDAGDTDDDPCGVLPCPPASPRSPADCPAGTDGLRCLPAAPHLPVASCPPGWMTKTRDTGPFSIPYCEPILTEDECEAGSRPKLGSVTCAAIGTPCTPLTPESARALAPDFDGAITFVEDGESVEAVVEAASAGDIVALRPGTFTGPVTLPSEVALVGTCMDTLMRSGTVDPAITVTGSAVLVSNLRIAGPGRGILVWGEAEVSDVDLDHPDEFGVLSERGGRARVTRSYVRSPGIVDDAPVSYGLVALGTLFTVNDSAVSGAYGYGVSVLGNGGQLEATELVILDGRRQAGNLGSGGIEVAEGASAEIDGVSISGVHGHGINTYRDAEADVVHAQIRGVLPQTDGTNGRGVTVEYGATVRLEATAILDVLDGGITVGESQVEFSDVVVFDVVPRSSDGAYGSGIEGFAGALIEAERVAIDRSTTAGLVGSGGSQLEVSDLVVSNVLLPQTDRGGFGVSISDPESFAIIERGDVYRGSGVGVLVRDATVQLTDVHIAETRIEPGERPEIPTGVGAFAWGGHLELERVEVDAVEGGGLMAESGSLVGSNLAVRGAKGLNVSGNGVVAQRDAVVDLQYVVLEGNVGNGLAAILVDTVTLQDATIRGTLPRIDGSRGRGVLLLGGGHLTADRVTLTDNHVVGIGLYADVSATLTDILVEDMKADTRTGGRGWGIVAQTGAQVTAARIAVRNVKHFGVVSLAEDTDTSWTDLTINGVRLADCAPDCVETGGDGGTAFLVADHAVAAVSSFEISGADLAGMQIADAQRLAAEQGLVHDNLIGVNIIGELNLEESFIDVTAQDNSVDFDAQVLSVPSLEDVDELIWTE